MNNELYHHGVLGMRWGVRKDRLSSGTSKKRSSQERADESVARKKSELARLSKNRKLLSDKTISEKINRLKLEKEFKNLVEEDINPGKKFAKEIFAESSKKAMTTMLTGAMIYAGKAAVSKTFNSKDFGEALFNGGAKKK